MVTNPLLYYQVAASVIPTLFIATAVTLKAFSHTEDDTPGQGFLDAIGVLSLAAGEAIALWTIKTGRPSSGTSRLVSVSLVFGLVILVLELALPRLLASLQLLRTSLLARPSRFRRARGVVVLVCLLILAAAVLTMLGAIIFLAF